MKSYGLSNTGLENSQQQQATAARLGKMSIPEQLAAKARIMQANAGQQGKVCVPGLVGNWLLAVVG